MRVPAQFRHAPDFGKVAVNGAWEQAASFQPGEFLGSEEILDYLSGGQEVACADFIRALEVDLDVPLARDFQYAEVGAEGA
jgi:hypothetical protein